MTDYHSKFISRNQEYYAIRVVVSALEKNDEDEKIKLEKMPTRTFLNINIKRNAIEAVVKSLNY